MDPEQADRERSERRPSAPTSNGSGDRPSSSSRRLADPPASRDEAGRNNGSGSGRPSSSRSTQGGSSRFDPRHVPARQRGVARDDGYLRKSQRSRRPTNYTEQYTPPADLLELRKEGLAKGQSGVGGTSSGIKSRLHRKSLDRSEGDSEHRGEAHRAAAGQHQEKALRASANQRQHELYQQQLAAEQLQRKDSRGSKEGQRQEQQPSSSSSSGGRPGIERQSSRRSSRRATQETSNTRRERGQDGGGDNNYGGEGAGEGRGEHYQQYQQRRQSSENNHGGAEGGGGREREQRSGRQSSSRRGSQSSSASGGGGGDDRRTSRRDDAGRTKQKSSRRMSQEERGELTEQQIEEYAGKRALLRLEQELADHDQAKLDSLRGADGSNPHAGPYGEIRSVMDRKKLARVPQVKKSALVIGTYLGRGNFCDVFEVTWTLPELPAARMFESSKSLRSVGSANTGNGSSNKSINSNGTKDDDGDDHPYENLNESMGSVLSCSNDLSLMSLNDDGTAQPRSSRSAVSQVRTASLIGGPGGRGGFLSSAAAVRNPNVLALKCLRPAVRAQPRKFVIGAEDLAHETALLACLDHPNIITLYGRAEGCFSTAFSMRSSNGVSSSRSRSGDSKGEGRAASNEGYFIILDRLMTTLDNRIEEWRDECRSINGVVVDGQLTDAPPERNIREHLCKRLKVAYSIADALEYLHSRHVVFRDLKPANVGFDCNDCVKMFDFGFATSIAPLLCQPYEGYGPLTETCGTRRYMAPEVALKLGYGKEVDVYSFGMLLWEICALEKPFDSIQSVDEFHDVVVLCGRRPSLKVDPLWTSSLKSLMSRCWSTDPLDRPTMVQVKSLLCNVLRDMNLKAMEGRNGDDGGKPGGGSRRPEPGSNFYQKWKRRVSI